MANIRDKEEDPFTRRKCMPRLVTFVSNQPTPHSDILTIIQITCMLARLHNHCCLLFLLLQSKDGTEAVELGATETKVVFIDHALNHDR